MKRVEYKLLSGDTQSRPINVVVDANSASATICWPYTITLEVDVCSSCVYHNNNCQTISITPNTNCEQENQIRGSLMWNGLEVFYKITQKKANCPCNEEKTYNVLIEDNKWVSPKSVYCYYDSKQITLHYEYYKITELCDKIIKKETIKKDVPINVECDCIGETSDKTGVYPTEEGFNINYEYKCIVDRKTECNCGDFDFLDDCGCNKFKFLGVDDCGCGAFDFKDYCDCNSFKFLPIDDCNCGKFEFIQDCKCDDFNFEKDCDCDNLEITLKNE